MNRLVFIFPIIALVLFFECSFIDSSKADNPIVGQLAPEISLAQIDGKTLKLSELKGKYVLVDFWASWCGPCLRDMPEMKEIYADYKDHNLEILGVSLDHKAKNWQQAIEKHELPWQHVSDLGGWNNQAALDYGVESIPHTVLIDPNGEIIAIGLRGEQLKKKIKRTLLD